MASVNLRSLVGRLDETCRQSLEAAAGLCLSRTHYNVEVEHWLVKLVEAQGADLQLIAKHFGADAGRLAADLSRALDRLKTGNARPPALSPALVELAKDAWMVASLDFEAAQTRSGHVLVALMQSEGLAAHALAASPEFEKIPLDALKRELAGITANSIESQKATSLDSGPAAPGARAAGSGRTPNLDQYTIDLTQRARSGHLDPVLGRETEIRQVIDILTRRRQNNPILTGEPGVGKTAVAEGFALKVVAGEVPPPLRNIAVRTLDLSLLQAGAGVKGEFENRLKGVIEEVKASPQPIVLFIDEAHTLIGAGGSAGQGDAANLLKPALARGELRTIAATTWAEYKKYFERDAALARRFQVVKVEEPSEEVAVQIMRGLAATMERHHGVRVLDEAIVDSVRLSMRYLSGRQLPDKSVSILDTACARVNLSQSATPAALEDCRRRKVQNETARTLLARENLASDAHGERLAALETEKVALDAEEKALTERWEKELALVKAVRTTREKLEREFVKDSKEAPLSGEEKKAARAELERLSKELRTLQGEEPLVHPAVDAQAIAEVISNWTGIPIGRMVSDQIQNVLALREKLEERVVGQSAALEALAQAIRTSRANLTDPSRPIGVFMLVGTSGVGKTETAIALAELLYGGEQNMTVINMSEFKEEHKVSLLMGSPPGYVGYGEGGVLTEAVRRKPYSVLLLDELEKAHPGVQDVFYQVFDKGQMKDGEGRDIDFRNTVILMTTNAGTDTIMSLWKDPETMPDAAGLAEALRPELLKFFKPAFLGRVSVLPYFPLSDKVLRGIIGLKLKKVAKRVEANYKAPFTWTPALVDAIAARCTEVDSGARNVDHILTRSLLPELAGEFLARLAEGTQIAGVEVDVDGAGKFLYRVAERR
ncbi:MAG: type VI secretion system ATPase TssH [Planctomycetota bacterium]|nr:type VI secretion system ATPase TssH [Planctomycetota bacterium]